ncbi:hypothetical protein N510_000676 [Firmicutes bacterium ASF500]|nr:hypothetical protein N510_000676 [Firmicutes bacterium ASF500]
MIWDLYDNSIAACKTATRQTVDLVLDTIRLAMRKEKKMVAADLCLHSDQGGQYTSQEYFDLTKRYGITPSMSRRGNCYDNTTAEKHFSILKTACICRQKNDTFRHVRELISEFIYFYDHELIQIKTGVAPLDLRHSRLKFLSPYLWPLFSPACTIWGGSFIPVFKQFQEEESSDSSEFAVFWGCFQIIFTLN